MAELCNWPVKMQIPVAWGDMDSFGHVNNTMYLRWCESARIDYFLRTGVLEEMDSAKIGPILAHAAIDYRVPVEFPDTIEISSTVTKLGNTSFTMEYRMCSSAKDGLVVALGKSIMVMVDYGSGKPVPLTDLIREKVLALEASGSAQ
mgnify:CR=1 FL=1